MPFREISILSLFFLLPFSQHTCAQSPFKLNYMRMTENKMEINRGDSPLRKAKTILLQEANKIIKKKPFTIVDNKKFFPNSSKHDYYSAAIYWWPNPDTKNGLPYVRKDGKTNKKLTKKFKDKWEFINVSRYVQTLGVAYFYTDEDKYAKKAKELLNTFFLEKKTRMNPNMEYSQIVKGHDKLRGNIIEARFLINLIDGVQLIRSSTVWNSKDQDKLEEWSEAFLNWMLHSETGIKESKRTNNIGTYYTNIAVTLALFIDDKKQAKKIMNHRSYWLIDKQISETGEMPFELQRATPKTYVKSNMEALNFMANLADRIGIDIRDYKNEKSGSIRKAQNWAKNYENTFLNAKKKTKSKRISLIKVDKGNFLQILTR